MRNRYVDLLRAVAIARVVVYHVTGWAALTVALPAMSVMFALGGSLMAASLDRHGIRSVGRRLRRLLPSLWLLAGIFVPVMLLTGLTPDWRVLLWLLPVQDPPAAGWALAALSANWYLRDFLWFVLLSPLALPLFRRFPVPTLAAPYLLLVVLELTGATVHTVIRDIGLYFGPWLLGFAHHDGRLRRLGRRWLLAVAGVLATAGAAWIVTHPGPRGFDLNDIRLGNALWSAAFIVLALGLAPASTDWLERRAGLRRAVVVLNHRALTIYLWHVPIIVGLGTVAAAAGWDLTGGAGTALRLLIVTALVALAVVLFGWVEDLAARRRPVLLPGDRAAEPAERAAGDRAAEPADNRVAVDHAAVELVGPRPAGQRAISEMSPLPVRTSSRCSPSGSSVSVDSTSPEPVSVRTR